MVDFPLMCWTPVVLVLLVATAVPSFPRSLSHLPFCFSPLDIGGHP